MPPKRITLVPSAADTFKVVDQTADDEWVMTGLNRGKETANGVQMMDKGGGLKRPIGIQQVTIHPSKVKDESREAIPLKLGHIIQCKELTVDLGPEGEGTGGGCFEAIAMKEATVVDFDPPTRNITKLTLCLGESQFFKVTNWVKDGWELQAITGGGTIGRGITCEVKGGGEEGIELGRLLVAVGGLRGKDNKPIDVVASDVLKCSELTIAYTGKGVPRVDELVNVVRMKDVEKTVAHLKEYVPPEKRVDAELMWTKVELRMAEINKIWNTSPSGAITAMSTLLTDAGKWLDELPDGVNGQNQFFSQAIHIMFDFLSNRVLLPAKRDNPELARIRARDPKFPAASGKKFLQQAKAFSRKVDARLNLQARNKLNSSKSFEFYLPELGREVTFATWVKGACEGEACRSDPENLKVHNVTRLCRKCTEQLRDEWDTSAADAAWDEEPNPAKLSGFTPSDAPPKEVVAKPAVKKAVKKAPVEPATVRIDHTEGMSKVEALVWGEDVLYYYDVDRHDMERENVVQEDIRSFRDGGEHAQADKLSDALWAIKAFRDDPCDAPPKVVRNVEGADSGCGYGLGPNAVIKTKKGGKNKKGKTTIKLF